MKTQLTMMTIDATIQLILIVLLGGTGFLGIITDGETIIILGLCLFATGAWQLLSGIIFGMMRNDGNRGKYVFGSIGYLILMGVGGNILAEIKSSSMISNIAAVIFIAIIPCLIAVWYFRYTQNDVKKLRNELNGLGKVDDTMNDILDSEEIFKSRI